jgi:hypothetical protein
MPLIELSPTLACTKIDSAVITVLAYSLQSMNYTDFELLRLTRVEHATHRTISQSIMNKNRQWQLWQLTSAKAWTTQTLSLLRSMSLIELPPTQAWTKIDSAVTTVAAYFCKSMNNATYIRQDPRIRKWDAICLPFSRLAASLKKRQT